MNQKCQKNICAFYVQTTIFCSILLLHLAYIIFFNSVVIFCSTYICFLIKLTSYDYGYGLLYLSTGLADLWFWYDKWEDQLFYCLWGKDVIWEAGGICSPWICKKKM